MSHVAAQLVDLFLQFMYLSKFLIRIPLKIYFAKPDALKGSLVQTLHKAQPTVHLGVPRVWEKVMDTLTKKLRDGVSLKLTLLELHQNIDCSLGI